MIQVYKLLSGKYDDTLPQLLTKSSTGLSGHKNKLYIVGANKDVRKYSFRVRVAEIWNSLPPSVVEMDKIIDFERELDKFWINQPLLYAQVFGK